MFDIWQDSTVSSADSKLMDTPIKKLRMLSNGIQQWYRSLPGFCKYASPDISFPNDNNGEMAKKCELFRNDLAGNIQSAREYLFERLPELMDSVKEDGIDYEKCVNELKVYKLKIEEMYDKLLEKLTVIVKNTFQSTGNLKESSLRTIFERWSEKNKEKLNGVVLDYSASILFKCVTDNDLNNEEKIINRISEGLTGLVLRDYKDETIEIFKQELKKSYDELEHMIKKENTTENAVSFTMDTVDGRQVKCKLSEYDESPATDLIEAQIWEVLRENNYGKNAQVSAVLKVLGDIVG